MRILIFTGGTGSIALQRGLYDALERQLDGIDTKIIVNAYDNGLSTGAVRRVMNGRILGPSDVRKNQTTRIRLQDPSTPWLPFLDCRFTAESSSKALALCSDKVARLMEHLEQRGSSVDCRRLLLEALTRFFREPLSASLEYKDFSLANIVYAGLAAVNGNSLRAAARIMAEAISIPDNVLLNDDRSQFLGAITRSGKTITDEADIVTWGQAADPIADVFFIDADGNSSRPELCLEAWKAIIEADLIILSSGTQWSSLIPTYASEGFKAAIRDSAAKLIMVMNRTPDKDSPGQTAGDIVDALVPRYFDEGRLHLLIDKNSDRRMRQLTQTARARLASVTEAELSGPLDEADKHDPIKLVNAIGHVWFNEYAASEFFLFDYDDTLCGRANQYPKSSSFNIEGISQLNGLTNVGICTGNAIRALNFSRPSGELDLLRRQVRKQLLVFADGGANEYSCDTRAVVGAMHWPEIVKCISPSVLLPQSGPHSAAAIINALLRVGIPDSKIENRGNAVIAVRPLSTNDRRAVMSLARNIVRDSDMQVVECGRTTIEIRKRALSKVLALRHLCEKSSNGVSITYVGDELESGNDHDIAEFAAEEPGVKCLHVDSPAKTAFFIYTLIAQLQRNVEH